MIPPHLDFRRLKQQVTIETVLVVNGLLQTFHRRGDRWTAPCPLHAGNNPRAFVVTPSKDLWYCFTRCQVGGDVVEFARRLLHLSYLDTARYLASLANNSPRPFKK